jgi:hypothetical protein
LPPTVAADLSELCLDIGERGWTVGGRKLSATLRRGNGFFEKIPRRSEVDRDGKDERTQATYSTRFGMKNYSQLFDSKQ